jgi:SPP1 family predicted phage head-tail adaptor
MPIIRLNRKIQFQNRTMVKEELGETEEWTSGATVRAARDDFGGAERFRSNQEMATRTTRFTIRWRRVSPADQRILHDGLLWDIEGLADKPNTRRQWLEIVASAIEPQ